MSGRLLLYVSAGPDLDQEREFIGQAIARLPLSLGWSVQYTPSAQEGHGADPEPILACHFHIILLGVDIRAPVGWELWVARGAGKDSMGFAKEVSHTPAATAFFRQSDVSWVPFKQPSELKVLVQEALARRLVENPSPYGVSLPEWEALSAFLKEPRRAAADRIGDDLQGSGAGRGGVILSPGHDLPPGGVLIGQKKSKRTSQGKDA